MQTKTVEKKSPLTIHTFGNINPVNTVEDGLFVGHFDSHRLFITKETVPLAPVTGVKNLHLVCFDCTIGETEYVELLAALGKRPCRNAPQYLLGLMAVISENQMPVELSNKDLIAAEPDNKSSVFAEENGNYCCFLYIRRGNGRRRLDLVRVDGAWWSGRCAFLAEDLVP